MLDLQKFAKLIVHFQVNVKKDDKVLIIGAAETIPLIKEIYQEVLRSEGHPLQPFIEFPGQQYLYHKEGQDFQLSFSDPLELYGIGMIDCLIMISGRENSKELANIPQEKINMVKAAKFKMMQQFYMRAGKGELKWTMTVYPTFSLAQDSGMSQMEMANLITKTCFLDQEDPIAYWESLNVQQQKYCDYLNQVDRIQLLAEGTDISFSVKERKWISSAGKGNMPDGEVFTGPIENSTNGTIKFSYPLIEGSRAIDNIQITFREGRVVDAKASTNQASLEKLLENPGARYVGELAIGTNKNHQNFIGNILFDEKMGGTVHIAIGNGYPETGSEAQSPIHKDMLLEMRNGGKIIADGRLIYENGHFLI